MSDDGEYKCHVLKTPTEPGIKTDPPVTLTVLGMIKITDVCDILKIKMRSLCLFFYFKI
jgi:hypothetical protein